MPKVFTAEELQKDRKDFLAMQQKYAELEDFESVRMMEIEVQIIDHKIAIAELKVLKANMKKTRRDRLKLYDKIRDGRK